MEFRFGEVAPHLMRPAGSGIPTFSAGKGSAAHFQSMLYKMIFPALASKGPEDLDPKQVNSCWNETWDWLSEAKVVLLGAPLDTGAGIKRGAAYGPLGVRAELYRLPEFQKWVKSRTVIDLGDVYVNPHLLHDEMLSKAQIELCQNEMYPQAKSDLRANLPVAALSQLKVLLQTLTKEYPDLHIQLIGGDHSAAWPVAEVLAKKYPKTLGIVQSDAHTDLLSSRLGVKYCFGTWSYHANALLKGDGRMVQVGIRQSGRDKAHWETTTGIKQYWAAEINSQPESEVISEIITHLKSKGVRHLYFSNDIDGTDEREAPSTGTPASGGLSSRFLLKLIDELGRNFEVVAGDVMEVAPDLGHSEQSSQMTCNLAARYMQACIEASISKE